METFRFVQGEPDCCPFKDYKCPHTGKIKKIVFIADIPLEERHKYLDPEQDKNHSCMKVVGHCKNKLENPMEAHTNQIAVLSNHMIELTNQLNELTKKIKNINVS